jgi:hypothetical protein
MDLTTGKDRWCRLRPMAAMVTMTDRVLAAGQEIINRVGQAIGPEPTPGMGRGGSTPNGASAWL